MRAIPRVYPMAATASFGGRVAAEPDVALKEMPKEEARVLFGSFGWPTGIIEVASWAKNRGAADVSVVPLDKGAIRWTPHLGRAIRRHGERTGKAFFKPEGGLSDETASALVDSDFVKALMEHRPTVVGFRVDEVNVKDLKSYIKAVRHFTDAVVVVGGPETTIFPKEVVDELGADFGFAGEAEEGFTRFLKVLGGRDAKSGLTREDYEGLLTIPGLVFRYGGQIHHNTLPRDETGRNALDPSPLFRVSEDEAEGVEKGSAAALSKAFAAHGLRLSADAKAEPLGKGYWKLSQKTGSDYYLRPSGGGYDVGYAMDVVERRRLMNLARPFAEPEVMNENILQWDVIRKSEKVFEDVTVSTSRGCPGACVFCSHIHGRIHRPKGALEIMRDVEALDRRVRDGSVSLQLWKPFVGVDDPRVRKRESYLLDISDDDFLLDRERALEFFRMWDGSGMKDRYRLGIQTNAVSLIRDKKVDEELMRYIGRFKVWVGMGAESFSHGLLYRWRKRHDPEKLDAVLDALEDTGQEYTVNLIASDFDMTPAEYVDNLALTAEKASKRRHMRVGYVPYMSPVYDSSLRKELERRGILTPDKIAHYTDYSDAHPELMDPLVVKMVDAAKGPLKDTKKSHTERVKSYLKALDEVEKVLEDEGMQDLLPRIRQARESVVDGMAKN
jgi:radical SAM superfamily enzyme YgiQ (UPF0313 family)